MRKKSEFFQQPLHQSECSVDESHGNSQKAAVFRVAIEQFGSPVADSSRLEFVLESSAGLSVRELIDQAVAKEIELRGLTMSDGKLVNRQREAMLAFARGTFAMLVDGEPMTDLDHVLPANDEREIVFIRVLPLVGG